jgi:hypothetical protein
MREGAGSWANAGNASNAAKAAPAKTLIIFFS